MNNHLAGTCMDMARAGSHDLTVLRLPVASQTIRQGKAQRLCLVEVLFLVQFLSYLVGSLLVLQAAH